MSATTESLAEALGEAILRIARKRGAEKSLCPSEAARAVAGEGDDWRKLMPLTREIAVALHRKRLIEVTQKGVVVDPETARGAIRLRISP